MRKNNGKNNGLKYAACFDNATRLKKYIGNSSEGKQFIITLQHEARPWRPENSSSGTVFNNLSPDLELVIFNTTKPAVAKKMFKAVGPHRNVLGFNLKQPWKSTGVFGIEPHEGDYVFRNARGEFRFSNGNGLTVREMVKEDLAGGAPLENIALIAFGFGKVTSMGVKELQRAGELTAFNRLIAVDKATDARRKAEEYGFEAYKRTEDLPPLASRDAARVILLDSTMHTELTPYKTSEAAKYAAKLTGASRPEIAVFDYNMQARRENYAKLGIADLVVGREFVTKTNLYLLREINKASEKLFPGAPLQISESSYSNISRIVNS